MGLYKWSKRVEAFFEALFTNTYSLQGTRLAQSSSFNSLGYPLSIWLRPTIYLDPGSSQNITGSNHFTMQRLRKNKVNNSFALENFGDNISPVKCCGICKYWNITVNYPYAISHTTKVKVFTYLNDNIGCNLKIITCINFLECGFLTIRRLKHRVRDHLYNINKRGFNKYLYTHFSTKCTIKQISFSILVSLSGISFRQ